MTGGVGSIYAGSDASKNPMLFYVPQDNQVYIEPFDPTGSNSGGTALTTAGQVKKVIIV